VTASNARARLIAKKVLDDLPAKTEKTKAHAGGLSPRMPKYKPEDRSLSRPAHAGGYQHAQASQNLLLNLYSLVKERPIAQAPPNAGETAVGKNQTTDSFEFGYFSRSPVIPAT
jgi:hypothetical protein